MMFEERSQVPPHICATELSAIVKQPFASQAIVESQRRIAELRKKNERVNVSIEESPRRFRHHAPAKAEPVVLPAQIDLAQLTLELALMGLAPRESNESFVPVLQDDNEVAPAFLRERLVQLPGARRNRRSTRRAIGCVPRRHV